MLCRLQEHSFIKNAAEYWVPAFAGMTWCSTVPPSTP